MKLIHVEASSYCNARCPLCPRNVYGYKVEGVYHETHLDPSTLKNSLIEFPDRKLVYFNGNLGDPMMNPKILQLIDVAKCNTSITTNGSTGNEATWKALAGKNVEVIFSIDGLADTNHLYRQDVEWSKLLQRIKWFIDCGGQAIWKFVLFKHNSHQQQKARALAKKLGFIDFVIEDHNRNFGPALHKNGTVSHWILPADNSKVAGTFDLQSSVKRYRTNNHNYKGPLKDLQISCEHLKDESVYIDAQGRISPCCYQGFDIPGRPFVHLKDTKKLIENWNTNNCNTVCASTCGKKSY